MKTKTHDRDSLISRLRREAIDRTGSRWTLYTRWDREAGGHIVTGLEQAGGNGWSRWNSRGFLHLEPSTITAEIVEAWPKTKTKYDMRPSYIGAKRILEILGAPISAADIREAKAAEEAERKAYRDKNVTRHAREKLETFHKSLDGLVSAGLVEQATVDVLMAQWAAIDKTLPGYGVEEAS